MKKSIRYVLALALAICLFVPAFTVSAETAAPELYNLRIMVAGDTPPDQQTVLDAVEEKTRDTLNLDITVDYIPWADYIEKVRMMSAAQEKFDICLSFSGVTVEAYNRKEMLALDDLLAQYGQNLLSKLEEGNWVWCKAADGATMAIPAQYLKDGIYSTYLVRKDLREKYGCAEIVDMETAEAFVNAVKENDPDVIPVWGDSIDHMVAHVNTMEFPGVYQLGYTGQGYNIGYWATEGDEAYTVKNWYATPQAENYVKWNTYANENGWFASDYCIGLDQYSTMAAGKVALFNIDYYHFNHMLDEINQTTPGADLEWMLINKGAVPVTTETCNNFAQISATSEDPARAVMFLDWIQADQANYDLWFYGIEGTHYSLAEDGSIVYPEGVDSTNLPYSPTPWYFRNKDYDRALSTDNDLTKTAMKYWTDVELIPMADTITFKFDTEPVLLELTQVNTVILEQWTDVKLGLLGYEDFLAELDAAGMTAVIAEMQAQLDAFRAAL